MNGEPIRYIRPVMPPPEEWLPYLRDSYTSGFFANFGPAVRLFEARLRDRFARGRVAVTSPSATAGLTCALQALGVSGKVLLPAYTFPASAHAVLMAGCAPVFCDVDIETWELAPSAVADALQDPAVGAIMHVRAYGFSHDLSWLETLARQRGIPLIVDAAAAIGGRASIDGHVGQQGDVEVFSFHSTKVFGIGEGAALFVRPEHEKAVRTASNFGISHPDVVSAGQNSKMSDFQAAVGLAVLDRIDGFVQRRIEVVADYRKALASHEAVASAPAAELAPWQSYPVRLTRDRDVQVVMEKAAALGLELKRGYFRPLHQTRYFSRFASGALPETEALAPQVINLPVYSDMSADLAARALKLFLSALA